jgi:hypothetical protein
MHAGMTGALSTESLSTEARATEALPNGHGSRSLPGAGIWCSGGAVPAASIGQANPLLPLIVLLVAAVLLQRFAVPVAEGQLGVGLVIGLVVAGLGVLRGWLVVEPTRFVLFCVMLAGILATLALAGQGFSVLSLAMFVLLYLPFILVLPLDAAAYRQLLGHLQTLLLVVAVSAMLQFAVQFVAGAAWMFPFDRLLPERLFVPGFNLVIPVSGGIVKSTGLWLLEPSILSQLMAIGIVVELARFRRPLVLATLVTGLGLAFSGTGLMLLVVFLPLLLIAGGLGGWLVVGLALAALAVWAFADVFPISYFVARLGEFGNPQASGSMRFFGPYWATADVFAGRPDLLWTGVGPGGMADAVWNFDYAVQDSSWLKLIVEYGLIGGLPFAVFYAYCLFAGCPDRWLAAALLFMVLFLGGYLLGYHAQFLILAMVVWPRPVAAPAAAATAMASPTQQPTSGRRDR